MVRTVGKQQMRKGRRRALNAVRASSKRRKK